MSVFHLNHQPLAYSSDMFQPPVKEKEKRQLDKQASQVARDVIDLENALGVRIKGVGSESVPIVR
jgi:hypothetical protein